MANKLNARQQVNKVVNSLSLELDSSIVSDVRKRLYAALTTAREEERQHCAEIAELVWGYDSSPVVKGVAVRIGRMIRANNTEAS